MHIFLAFLAHSSSPTRPKWTRQACIRGGGGNFYIASQVAIMQMVRGPESIQALGQGQADNEKYSHKNNKYGCCS